jgi:hypothetical protein
MISHASQGDIMAFVKKIMLDSRSQSLTVHGVRGIRRRVRA